MAGPAPMHGDRIARVARPQNAGAYRKIIARIQSGVNNIDYTVSICLLSCIFHGAHCCACIRSCALCPLNNQKCKIFIWTSMCNILGQYSRANLCTTTRTQMPSGPDNVIRLLSNCVIPANSTRRARPPGMGGELRVLHAHIMPAHIQKLSVLRNFITKY